MNILFDVGMAVGPTSGYMYQYRLIHIKQAVGTFSIDICGILLFANIMRLNFYIFERYKLALLFQSLIMMTVQLLLLKLCAQLPVQTIQADMTELQTSQPKYNQIKQQFWRWNKFRYYIFTIIIFAIASFSISFLFYNAQFMIYGQLVGVISLLSQSILISPQILKNFRMGKIKGLSHLLVMFNWSGDIIKVIYFLLNKQPFQFIMCGVIQIMLDSTVIGQIIYYKRKERKLQNDRSPLKEKKQDHQTLESGSSNGDIQMRTSDREYQTEINMTVKDEDISEEISQQQNNSITQELSNKRFEEKVELQ